MVIESVELKNFRNYENLHIEFDSKTNILYGNNAQGKTNILEAIYTVCTTKSHRGSKDREMIQFQNEEAHIKMNIRKNNVPYRIDMHLKKNKAKGIAINGIPIKKASELFGIVNVVCFSPEDLNLIKNGPSDRRKFMDMELCQLNKLYVHALVQYNRIITQRNKLLKELYLKPEYESTLEIWDLQLIEYGNKIIEYRNDFIDQLNEIISVIHCNLSGKKENLKIVYEPNVKKENFAEMLLKSRNQDIKQKMTLVGPHRDDFSFYTNDMDIRKFGSQGQQRTAALSLKLSEIEIVKRIIKDHPILLLDDVLSELDSNRQNQLLSEIDNIQTIITCTGLEEFVNNRFEINKLFKIDDGKVFSEN